MHKDNVVLSIFKGILSLSIIALVCTVLLGVVSIITAVDPKKEALEKFNKLSGQEYTEITEVNHSYGDGKVLYYAKSTDGAAEAFLSRGNGGYGGPVEVYVFLENQTIKQIELGMNEETYTDKLYKPSNGHWNSTFFEHFIDKEIEGLEQLDFKNCGPTLSATAIQRAILAVQDYYKKVNPTENQTISSKSSVNSDYNVVSRQLSMSNSDNNRSTQLAYSGKDTNSTTKNLVGFLSRERQNNSLCNLKELEYSTIVLENLTFNSFNHTVECNLFHRYGGGF